MQISFAPNSVWLQRSALDKAVPLRFLLGRTPLPPGEKSAYHGVLPAPTRAVALGDSPESNDGPMGGFAADGLEFVSVSADAATVPPELAHNHVGGTEAGTALFLNQLMDLLDARKDGEGELDLSVLTRAAARQCRN